MPPYTTASFLTNWMNIPPLEKLPHKQICKYIRVAKRKSKKKKNHNRYWIVMRIRSGILARVWSGQIFIRFYYTCLWTNLKGSYNIWHWQEPKRSSLTIIIHVAINQLQPVCFITAAFKAELRLWIDIRSLKVNELRAIKSLNLLPENLFITNYKKTWEWSSFFHNPWICASTVHIQNHTYKPSYY